MKDREAGFWDGVVVGCSASCTLFVILLIVFAELGWISG